VCRGRGEGRREGVRNLGMFDELDFGRGE